MSTIYATHTSYANHHMPGYQHPEHPGRIESVWQVLQAANLPQRMQVIAPNPVTDAMILRVHEATHLDTLKWVSAQEKLTMFDSDTYALPESAQIARLSAGGVVDVTTAVATGSAANGLAAVRPPGHHATPQRAMGFCLLSNVAIAARHAQTLPGIEKVMIVDIDVHHGNGTQDVFYDDPSILFVSTHQHPFYPGTGKINEAGRGDGRGFTLNVPLSAGHGDSNYMAIMHQIIRPAAARFQPDLLLVSVGFDAHFVDPLAMMRLSLVGYVQLVRELKQIAHDLCDGKIVIVMEGGYDLQALGHGMRNMAHILLEEDDISDPYGLDSGKQPDVQPLIAEVLKIHDL